MSGTGSDRGWITVLLLLALLTAACVVGYVAAPFDPPPSEGVERTADHVVAPEHRIVAIRDGGSLVLLDARDGTVSDRVVPDGLDAVDTLDVGRHREAAYLGSSDGTVSVVRLRTGAEDVLTAGIAPDIGPLSFPQLDADIERPEVEQLAAVVPRDGGGGSPRIAVENLVTGSRSVLAVQDEAPFRDVEVLAWSPVENRLFGIADDGRTLFRLDTDRVRSLDEAVVSEPVPAGSRWVDVTAFGDGIAAIRATEDGTEIVEIERRRLEEVAVLHRSPDGVEPVEIDADPAGRELLVTTAAGQLLRVIPTGDGAATVEHLTDGIVHAAW